MRKAPAFILLALISASCVKVADPAVTEAGDVLFVGNSFTGHNDLPGIISALVTTNGVSINAGKAVTGGQSIAGHARDERTLTKLASQTWDCVILQGHSLEPILKKAQMIAGGKELATRTGDARLYVFVTWAYGSKYRFLRKSGALNKGADSRAKYEEMYGNMQGLLNDGYSELAEAITAEVVPVGSVWEAVRKQYPELNLFGKDSYHPSRTGSYLTALVFYNTLFGALPEKAVIELADQATHDKLISVIDAIVAGTR